MPDHCQSPSQTGLSVPKTGAHTLLPAGMTHHTWQFAFMATESAARRSTQRECTHARCPGSWADSPWPICMRAVHVHVSSCMQGATASTVHCPANPPVPSRIPLTGLLLGPGAVQGKGMSCIAVPALGHCAYLCACISMTISPLHAGWPSSAVVQHMQELMDDGAVNLGYCAQLVCAQNDLPLALHSSICA